MVAHPTARTVRTTLAALADLRAAVDRAVREGKAKSRAAWMTAALRRELAIAERAAIDAAFAGMRLPPRGKGDRGGVRRPRLGGVAAGRAQTMRRGEVYGSEQAGSRPVVIVSRDAINAASTLVLAVP